MKLPWTKEQPAPEPVAAKLNKLETAMLKSLTDEPEKWSCELAPGGSTEHVKATNRTLKEIVVVVSWPFAAHHRAECGALVMSARFASQWHAIALNRATDHANELRRKEVERAKARLALIFDAV